MTFFGCVFLLRMRFQELTEPQTISQLPNSRASVKHVHLVESSPALRAVQQKKLQPWDGKNGLKIHWYDSIDDVPAADGTYTMLVAHEFFDALPFHLIEVRDLRQPIRQVDTLLLENTPRLERGIDHLHSRPGRQDYPETIGCPCSFSTSTLTLL